MGHLSIAILKKRSSRPTSEDSKFDYLVIKDGSDKLKFFEQESNAIGGNFDYSGFKNYILNYF